MEDYNLNNKKKPYKNIMELRTIKNTFLTHKMPKLVKNFILIRYEDLVLNLHKTLNLIKKKGLIIKKNINYPVNINKKYQGGKIVSQEFNETNKNKNTIMKERFKFNEIYNHPNFNIFLETKMLGYNLI